MSYAWVIDIDHQPDETVTAPSNLNAKGMVGPRRATDAMVGLLQAGQGEPFRMRDDDGNLYYSGRIVGEYEGFEPLDDFGMPNAGATTIEYKRGNRWQDL